MRSTVLQVRIDDKLRGQSAQIFQNLGLDMSSAVRLFLNRVVIEQGLPFPMRLPEAKDRGFDPIAYLDKISKNSDI